MDKPKKYDKIVLDMSKLSLKSSIIKLVTQKFSDRFKIIEEPCSSKALPNIILTDKKYDEPIFDMFILEPMEDPGEKLKGWKTYINKSSEKHYILVPKDKFEIVESLVDLMSGNILVAKYTLKDDGKAKEVIFDER